MQERAARSGKPDAPNFLHAASAKALMHRIVFAIDWQQRFALPPGFGGYEFTRRYQAFFVGQADRFTGANCFVCGFQPSHSDDCADYKIDLRMSSNLNVTGGAMGDFNFRD